MLYCTVPSCPVLFYPFLFCSASDHSQARERSRQDHITSHYTTSHYTTSHYTTLHHITLHYITLHHITFIERSTYPYQPAMNGWKNSGKEKKKKEIVYEIDDRIACSPHTTHHTYTHTHTHTPSETVLLSLIEKHLDFS